MLNKKALKIKVLIADDHEVVREGIKQLLSKQPDIEVVGEARDGKEAIEKARLLHPNVVLLDISMPGFSGLEAVTLIRALKPAPEIVILTIYSKDSYVRQLLSAGVKGYVLKASPTLDIIKAIRAAYNKEIFLSSKLQEHVVSGYLKSQTPAVSLSRYDLLTEREQQIFRLIAQGNSSREIADFLCISGKTVEKHRSHIMNKLGLRDRFDLLKYAIKIGIMDPETWNE